MNNHDEIDFYPFPSQFLPEIPTPNETPRPIIGCGLTNPQHIALPPTRRWSSDDSIRMMGEMPASNYHNLGFILHNHMHMSNRRHPNFDCDVATSAAPSDLSNVNQSRMAPNNMIEEGAPIGEHVFHQHAAFYHNHHHPYRNIGMEQFAVKNPRSISAPSVTNPGVPGCINGAGLGSSDLGMRRRFRTNFTEQQALFLEDSFRESHYPDHKAKREMATFLNIPEDRITVWFQNRRAKWRRKEHRDRERTRGESFGSFDYVGYQSCSDGGVIPSHNQIPMDSSPKQISQMMPDFSPKPTQYLHHDQSQYHNSISRNI